MTLHWAPLPVECIYCGTALLPVRHSTPEGKDPTSVGTETPLRQNFLVTSETKPSSPRRLPGDNHLRGPDDNDCYWCCISVSMSTCHVGSHR